METWLPLLAEFLERHYSGFVIVSGNSTLVARFSVERLQVPLIHCSSPVENVLKEALEEIEFDFISSFFVFAVKKLIEAHKEVSSKKGAPQGIGLQLLVQAIVHLHPEVVSCNLLKLKALYTKCHVQPNVALPLFWCLSQTYKAAPAIALHAWFTIMLPCFSESDASQQVLAYCVSYVEGVDFAKIEENPYVNCYSDSGQLEGRRHVISSYDYELLLRVTFLDSSELCRNSALKNMQERMQGDVCIRLESLAVKSRVPHRRANVSSLSRKDQKDFFLTLLKYCTAKELKLSRHVMAVVCACLVKFPKTYFSIWKDIYCRNIIIESNFIMAYILDNWTELSAVLPKSEIESAAKFFKAKNASIQDSENLSKKQEHALEQNSSRCEELHRRVPELKNHSFNKDCSSCCSLSVPKVLFIALLCICAYFYPTCGVSTCSSSTPCEWYHPCVLGENSHLFSLLRGAQATGRAAVQYPIVGEKVEVVLSAFDKYVAPHADKALAGSIAMGSSAYERMQFDQHLEKMSRAFIEFYSKAQELLFEKWTKADALIQKTFDVDIGSHLEPAFKEVHEMKYTLKEGLERMHQAMFAHSSNVYGAHVESRLPQPMREFVAKVLKEHSSIYNGRSYHSSTPVLRG